MDMTDTGKWLFWGGEAVLTMELPKRHATPLFLGGRLTGKWQRLPVPAEFDKTQAKAYSFAQPAQLAAIQTDHPSPD